MHHRAAWFRLAPATARLLAGALVLPPAVQAAPQFQASSFGYYVHRGANEAVLADFDGDGEPDLATASDYPLHRITLLRGLGDGSFAAWDTLAPTAAYGLAVADLDLDGKLDLVSQGHNTTQVWLGNGDLTFAAGVNYSLAEFDFGIGNATGDLIGDAHPEVVSPDSTDALVVWRGVGGGVLAAAATLPIRGDASGVRIADLDHDGDGDVVVRESVPGAMDSARVFLNVGGAFAAGVAYATSEGYGIRLADLDEDGHLDVLSGSTWLRGHGDGAFDAAALYATSDDVCPFLVDLDGDGLEELFTRSDASPQRTHMRRGLGGGTFGPVVELPFGYAVNDYEAADLNGDGHRDLLSCGYTMGEVLIHMSDGSGHFPTDRSFDAGGAPFEVAIADLSEDGIPEVLALSSSRLRVLNGLGGGALGSPDDYVAPGDATRMLVADLDADGHLDVVTLGLGLSVFEGQGGGRLTAPVGYTLPAVGRDFASGDVTGDAVADVVVITLNAISVYPGQPGSGLAPRIDYAITAGREVGIGEFTGDSRLDVVAFLLSGSALQAHVFPGQPDGTLGSPIVTPLSSFVSAGSIECEIGDTEGDGKLDIIVSHGDFSITFARRFPGNGDGTFGEFIAGFMGRGKSRSTIADFDADGRSDLAFSGFLSGVAWVGRGNLESFFAEPRLYGTTQIGNAARGLAAGDLDGDGLVDLVVADPSTQKVTILLQTTGGVLDAPAPIRTAVPRLALRVWPTIAREAVNVSFALPARGETVLEMFDVGGRRLSSRAFGVMVAGAHERSFEIDAAIPAGVVWLRLRQGGASAVAKAVVAR